MSLIRVMKVRDAFVGTIRCSFCDKGKEDVARLISGPGVYICNECVELCRKILEEEAARST